MATSFSDIDLLQQTLFGFNASDIGTGALIVIMTTMGLTLRPSDFAKLAVDPKSVGVGLVGQLVLLPAWAFMLVWLFSPPPALALGLIILACCPGGATSNFFSYLARGDVALSVVLTVLSGAIVIFTLPLLINFALANWAGTEQTVRLPVLRSMLQIFLLIIAPVLVGMGLRALAPRLALAIEPLATKVSFGAVLLTMGILLAAVWPFIPTMLASAGALVLALNAGMMAAGFGLALAMKAGEPQARTISVEIGVQNYILSVVIAVAMLKTPQYALVPVVYLFTMYVTVFAFIAYCRWVRPAPRVTN